MKYGKDKMVEYCCSKNNRPIFEANDEDFICERRKAMILIHLIKQIANKINELILSGN